MLRIFVVLFIVLLLGGLGYLGFQHMQLQGAYEQLQSEFGASEKKVAQLQKRYRDQKSLEANLLRTKLALEGQVRNAKADVKKVEEQLQAIMEAKEAGNAVAAGLRVEIAARKEEIAKLKETGRKLLYALKLEQKRYQKAIDDRNKVVSSLNDEIYEWENKFAGKSDQLDFCRTNNGKLTTIANEILAAYEGKDVLDSMLAAEPFIQSKKIEIEHFVQEYQDKIEEQQVEAPAAQ